MSRLVSIKSPATRIRKSIPAVAFIIAADTTGSKTMRAPRGWLTRPTGGAPAGTTAVMIPAGYASGDARAGKALDGRGGHAGSPDHSATGCASPQSTDRRIDRPEGRSGSPVRAGGDGQCENPATGGVQGKFP